MTWNRPGATGTIDPTGHRPATNWRFAAQCCGGAIAPNTRERTGRNSCAPPAPLNPNSGTFNAKLGMRGSAC
eukprot:1246888-Lingulodinium_polyedra.AAC.1